MAGNTSHYGLQRLQKGDPFSLNGYKFTDADREQIDRLLWALAHHAHTGITSSASTPSTAPTLTQAATGGSIPAGTRVYYKYTYVDSSGSESAESIEAFVDTPAAITEPGAPSLSQVNTGGALIAGNYYYVLTAYTNSITQETLARNPAYITVPVGTSTNKITLTLPTKPSGATGFNIYRRRPGGTQYLYCGSTTSTTTFVDNGALVEDCNRTVPQRNTTNSSNKVTVTLPGATPAVPAGLTWKVYRTYVNGNWETSLLWHVVEETFEGSGVIVPYYVDIGIGTSPGKPPQTNQYIDAPDQVDLTDAAEVTGSLPLGLTAFPVEVRLTIPGTVGVGAGSEIWVCEYPEATILACRANVSLGHPPASTDIIADVNMGSGATPTFSTIFTTQGNRPRVPVGFIRGNRKVPDVKSLVVGDMLTIDVDQSGAGATPTDRDLTVTIYLIAHGYPTGTSFIPGTTTGT